MFFTKSRRRAAAQGELRRECGWHLRDTAGSIAATGFWQLAPMGVNFPRSGCPGRLGMALIPIVELGVAEAYDILTRHFGVTGLPPLDAIENEDWGRDYVLSRLFDMPAASLRRPGLSPTRGIATIGPDDLAREAVLRDASALRSPRDDSSRAAVKVTRSPCSRASWASRSVWPARWQSWASEGQESDRLGHPGEMRGGDVDRGVEFARLHQQVDQDLGRRRGLALFLHFLAHFLLEMGDRCRRSRGPGVLSSRRRNPRRCVRMAVSLRRRAGERGIVHTRSNRPRARLPPDRRP